MFVIILTYKKPIEEVDKHRPKHLEFLDKYYSNNIFLASGRQVPLKGGVILANAESREVIETVIQDDPFYTEGIADFEIIEFTPNKYHGALETLI